MIRDPLAVVLAMAAVVFVSVWMERRVRMIRAVGSVLTAIVLGALLSNVGVLPAQSEAYGILGGMVVSLGIALILLGVDIRTVLRAGPGMLAAFALGAVGTVMGGILGGFLLADAVGPETWKLAGQYTGTYIGGGVNMVAVGQGVETSAELFSAAVAADNVTTTLWMAVCLILPATLARFWPVPTPGVGGETTQTAADPDSHEFLETDRRVSLTDVAALVVLAFGAVWSAEQIGRLTPGVPSVLWLTTIALAAAQVPVVQRLAGGPLLGNYALHLFLAALGAQSIISEILRVGLQVFWFTLVVIGLHGLVLFTAGRLFRLDLATLTVASQANVGGPASAMALATAKGYGDRVLPGVAVGLLGYAVGNYAGFAVAGVMRTLIG